MPNLLLGKFLFCFRLYHFLKFKFVQYTFKKLFSTYLVFHLLWVWFFKYLECHLPYLPLNFIRIAWILSYANKKISRSLLYLIVFKFENISPMTMTIWQLFSWELTQHSFCNFSPSDYMGGKVKWSERGREHSSFLLTQIY